MLCHSPDLGSLDLTAMGECSRHCASVSLSCMSEAVRWLLGDGGDTGALTTPLTLHVGRCHSVMPPEAHSSTWEQCQAEGPGSLHGLKAGAALSCGEFNLL